MLVSSRAISTLLVYWLGKSEAGHSCFHCSLLDSVFIWCPSVQPARVKTDEGKDRRLFPARLLLSSHPTCPLDPIPSHLLQAISPTLLLALTHIINTSLLTGIFPTAFKQARVTPLLNKPTLNTSLIENYRPVSLLPFIAKTLERVVFNQVSLFLSQNNKLDAKQSEWKDERTSPTAQPGKNWASCLPCNSNSTAWLHNSVRFINNYPISFGQKSWCNLWWPADLQRAHCEDCSILQVCTSQHHKDQFLSDRACCTTSCPGPCHF